MRVHTWILMPLLAVIGAKQYEERLFVNKDTGTRTYFQGNYRTVFMVLVCPVFFVNNVW